MLQKCYIYVTNLLQAKFCSKNPEFPVLNKADNSTKQRDTLHMADQHAKYATEHLSVAAARIENGRIGSVVQLSRLCHAQSKKGTSP